MSLSTPSKPVRRAEEWPQSFLTSPLNFTFRQLNRRIRSPYTLKRRLDLTQARYRRFAEQRQIYCPARIRTLGRPIRSLHRQRHPVSKTGTFIYVNRAHKSFSVFKIILSPSPYTHRHTHTHNPPIFETL